MTLKIAPVNPDAESFIPPAHDDASGIGVHYIDNYIKGMNLELEDGTKVSCKRKGLKILLGVGDAKGEAIVNRLEYGPDVRDMLRHALEAAAVDAGFAFGVDDGTITLTPKG